MGRAFGEMLRAVGMEMQREGFVLPDEMKRPHWTFRRMYGALGLDEVTCDSVVEHLDGAHLERHLWCGVDSEVPRVLDELKRQGLLLAVISNTEDGRLIDSLDAAGITDRFDLLIDSHLVGLRKPDAAIFQLALERLELEADEAAYRWRFLCARRTRGAGGRTSRDSARPTRSASGKRLPAYQIAE